jgi:hypothetical protein
MTQRPADKYERGDRPIRAYPRNPRFGLLTGDKRGNGDSAPSLFSLFAALQIYRLLSVFHPCSIRGSFCKAMNRRGRRESQRRRVSLRSSANSAVQSDELSACRWDTFRRAFICPELVRRFSCPTFSCHSSVAAGRRAGFHRWLLFFQIHEASLIVDWQSMPVGLPGEPGFDPPCVFGENRGPGGAADRLLTLVQHRPILAL